jgi:HK97 family phage major capsid protein
MMEVKSDGFAAAFDVAATQDELAGLKSELGTLKAQVAAQTVAAARPLLDGTKAERDAASAAFTERYLRRGLDAGTEMKSLSGATGGDGGFAVPREIDQQIEMMLKAMSPIRALAQVVSTGTAGYRKLVATTGFASGWVSETATRPETTTPVFAEVAPPSGYLYANPAASQGMLDDAAFDLEGWLADEVAREFARAEGQAFVTGDGVNRPKGFLTYPTTNQADSARAYGTIQYVAAGAAGAFIGANPHDRIVDLVHSLSPVYRQGAAFVMSSATLAAIRKFKTTDGAFIWQPSLQAGQPATLLGYPVIEAEDMPVIAADSLSIAFGNFQAAYVIADRGETGILRDPFSNKPYVHFYATKRVGGAVTNSAAIKLMKFSAS